MESDQNEVWAALIEPPGLKVIDDETFGDLITIEDYMEDVKDGSLVDYDGFNRCRYHKEINVDLFT